MEKWIRHHSTYFDGLWIPSRASGFILRRSNFHFRFWRENDNQEKTDCARANALHPYQV